jgi:hypothetical protein
MQRKPIRQEIITAMAITAIAIPPIAAELMPDLFGNEYNLKLVEIEMPYEDWLPTATLSK